MNVAPKQRGERLDRAVQSALAAAGHPASVREVRRALEERRILIDGRPCAPGARARGGEAIALVSFVARREAVLEPEPALLELIPLVADEPARLVLSKPSGIPTHPLRAGETGTLLHAAIARAKEIGQLGPPLEGGAVHRLDTPTSGVVVFARSEREREALRESFRRHRVQKRYLALCFDPAGIIGVGEHTDAVHIGPGPVRSRVAVVRGLGAPRPDQLFAETTFRRLETLVDGFAWIEASTFFGRRHQIRAQLASLGAPIAADVLYGGPQHPDVPRMALHAAELVLPDGTHYFAPPPEDLESARARLGRAAERARR